ncbi:tetratricopeptide repeat protein [Tsuneonella amylolytica]|uniref:tetratricopeptide repeat protein n=1 Tax=Tsuneonella amylolytica TaxID=2338327 RepID=UPI000EA8C446|nr:tetratricopeptide repeat protein [Tsuneonella amylolytica]
MTFVPVIVLAALTFAFAALALRLPKSGWALTGAALLAGLAGYALQGSPGQAGAPKAAVRNLSREGETLVETRRALFGPIPDNRFVTVADGFARRGQFGDAAGILRGAIDRSPRDPEAWLALAIALTEQADGRLTPAALFAYDRAQRFAPGNPGPSLFLGVSLIRSGRLPEARVLWAEMLANAPADAPWRAAMQERLDRLDNLLAETGAR